MSDNFINILVAEDNEVSREMMTSILKTQGYEVFGAVDGGSAIRVIQDRNIDLAFVDINMSPEGGFEFVKYLVVEGINLPVVIITGDRSTDVLSEASSLGVRQVMQKPIKPDKLIMTTRRILKRRGLNTDPLAVVTHDTIFSAHELMDKAIALAARNVQEGRGGPFAAIIANKEGHVLGEGTSGVSSRADPSAHAEVMAIRQAAEKLGQTDLHGCTLYCTSEPTAMGRALITSVGIEKVYYGLSHEDIMTGTPKALPDTHYEQLSREATLEMFKNSKSQKRKNP